MRNRHERKSKAKQSKAHEHDSTHVIHKCHWKSSVPKTFYIIFIFLAKNFRGKVHVDIFVEPLKNHAMENHTMEIHVNC